MMRQISDDELIYMIHQGNDEAVNLMLQRYESYMRNWALKSIRTQKERQVELTDMMQIGRLELYQVIGKYRNEEGNFFSFLKLCIEREFYTYIRGFLANVVPNYHTISLDEPVNDHSNYTYVDFFESQYFMSYPDRVYELQEEIEQIYQSDLSELEKQTLSMKMMGCTYEEIADKLGLSRKKVDNLIARIKTKIRVKR